QAPEPPAPGQPASAVPPARGREPQQPSWNTGEYNTGEYNTAAAGGTGGLGDTNGAQRSGGTNGTNGAGFQGLGAGSAWQSSANDERWRRAGQIREPAAGGITASGLPRRVPRANLVEGAAQPSQQPEQVGPQVSRAPDDVRGRLTNLRRGIQQGRRAGTGLDGNHDRGVGPTYQQER
ncbi:histidine kinase, partial [Streptomyces botrytidirepellens]